MSAGNAIVDRIRQISATRTDAVALCGAGAATIHYGNLIRQIDQCANLLGDHAVQRVAIDLENGPAWAVVDLALLQSGKISIPIPAFFTPSQREHLFQDAAVQLVVTATPEHYSNVIGREWVEYGGEKICLVTLGAGQQPVNQVPIDTCKITYTSGTTGEPKGVCISISGIAVVVQSIVERMQVTNQDRHLSLLPLTTLLENICGLYAPLTAGASVTLLPQQMVGVQGASGLDVSCFVEQIQRQRPTTTILIPQMVKLLVNVVESNEVLEHQLRFIAVGGAPISEELLSRASTAGLPLYEGYGLSEATSVVTCNVPGENRTGTVGRPLPHVDLKIADDGEVLVRGGLFEGYLGKRHDGVSADGYLSTGDLGDLDDEGYLTLRGRKKSLLITAFGRNVAPEWVEREIVIEPGILQAALFGEGRPWNVAILVAHAEADIERAVDRVNQRLPDYARISRWMSADEPFSVENGEWTGTARPRREAIWEHYGAQIDALYSLEGEVNL